MSDADRIERRIANLVRRLRPYGMHWAGRYNGPVYLVGSTLTNPSPRDCDIRITVEDVCFAARYNARLEQTEKGLVVPFVKDGPTQRWVDDVAKFNDVLSRILKTNMDIQVWPSSLWNRQYPRPILLAQPSGSPWIYNRFAPEPVLGKPKGPRQKKAEKA